MKVRGPSVSGAADGGTSGAAAPTRGQARAREEAKEDIYRRRSRR